MSGHSRAQKSYDVRYWPKADIPICTAHVCLGVKRTSFREKRTSEIGAMWLTPQSMRMMTAAATWLDTLFLA